MHLLIAWLAFQLAIGDQEGKASTKGAMQQLAEQSYGEVLLWAIAIGMFFLVVWRLLEAAVGHRDEEGAKRWWKRADSLGKAIIYGAVGYIALQVALDAGSGKGRSTTAKLMDEPFGQWLVGLVGLGVDRSTAATVRRGWTEKFMEHLTAEGKSGEAGKAYLRFGKVGYIAKGIAIVIIGGLFIYAAIEHERQEVRRPRRGAAQGARAAVRPGPARSSSRSASAATACSASPGPGTCPSDRARGRDNRTAPTWRSTSSCSGSARAASTSRSSSARPVSTWWASRTGWWAASVPYYGCVPSKMMIAAAHVVADVHRVPDFAGTAQVQPDWGPGRAPDP